MKLIPMTDFVLKQNELREQDKLSVFDFGEKVVKYANFLKQPLNLGMFVPCDLEGNVLQEPKMKVVKIGFDEEDVSWDIDEVEFYRNAKERVLFDGFMDVDTRKEGQIYFALKQSHRKNNIDYIMNDTFGLFFYNASNEKARLNTIEDLLDFNELILTKSAIKQIGLNLK